MIQVINRAFDILEYVAQERSKPKLMGEIARDLNLNTSTCANIIKTLLDRGVLKKASNEKGYLIGARLIEISNGTLGFKDLIHSASSILSNRELMLNENCLIAVLTNQNRRVIFSKKSDQLIQATTPDEKPAYDSSTGRLLIAFLDDRELQLYLSKHRLPNKETWPQASSRVGFFEEIKKIKSQGYALIEDSVQVVGVATPILKNGKVIASFSIYLPSFRFDIATKNKIINKAIELSKLLSS